MHAMLLAAGRGERMRPLTDSRPKPLIEVGGMPLIEWHLRKLAAAGFENIVINNAWLGEQIRQFVGDGQRWGLRVVHSDESQALETAGGIAQALPWLGGEPFLVMNADVWTDWDPAQARAMGATLDPEHGPLAHLIMVSNPCHHPKGDFYLQSDGQLSAAPQKSNARDKLTFSGIGVYHPAFFAETPRGERAPLAPLLREHMARAQVIGQRHAGQWHDIGTPTRLQELERLLARPSG